jgi:hypothetical protein
MTHQERRARVARSRRADVDAKRHHDALCRCVDCRHARFTSPPDTTSRRRLNFYGKFRRAAFKPWQRSGR